MAYSYNGTTNYSTLASDVSNIPNLEGATYAAICGWVYMNATPGTFDGFFGMRGGSSNNTRLGFNLGTTGEEQEPSFFCSNSSQQSYIQSNVVLSTGTWHHLFGYFDGSQADQSRIKMYVNGTLATETNNGASGPGSAEPTSIASDLGAFYAGVANDASNQPCNCRVAEVAIWAGTNLNYTGIAPAIAKGLSPLFFPTGLSFYAPMVRDIKDLVSGIVGSNSGASVVDHPKIIYPSTPIISENTNRRKIGEPASSPPSCRWVETKEDTTNATSYSFASTNFGDWTSTRTIVCVIGLTDNTALSTISIGDDSSPTLVAQDNSVPGNYHISIYTAQPTGTSGTVSITVGTTSVRAFCSVYRLDGMVATAVDSASDDTSTASVLSLPLDIPRRGVVIAGVFGNSTAGGGPGPFTSNLLSLDYEKQEFEVTAVDAATLSGFVTSGTQKDVQINLTNAEDNSGIVAVGAVFTAAAAA